MTGKKQIIRFLIPLMIHRNDRSCVLLRTDTWKRSCGTGQCYDVITGIAGRSRRTRMKGDSGRNMKEQRILYVNACIRKNSRTRFLAEQVIRRLKGTVAEVHPVSTTGPITSEEFIINRTEASCRMDFTDPAYTPARQFAEADIIVIAAPYWDLSFPAILKAYFEQINVVGLTFEYTDEGIPRGLCKARKLIYVTTAGGPIISDEYGYGYVKTLAQNFYGISDVCQIKAEGLDVIGADVEDILNKALEGFRLET